MRAIVQSENLSRDTPPLNLPLHALGPFVIEPLEQLANAVVPVPQNQGWMVRGAVQNVCLKPLSQWAIFEGHEGVIAQILTPQTRPHPTDRFRLEAATQILSGNVE